EGTRNGRRRFGTEVRDRYRNALRLAGENPVAAAELALDAFAGEHELATKDVEVAMLACSLATRVVEGLSAERRQTLQNAREWLARFDEQYRHFFERYPTQHALLHATKLGSREGDRTLLAQWHQLCDLRDCIQAAVATTPPGVSVPPIAIEKEWREAVTI